jgi:hypothetical protein
MESLFSPQAWIGLLTLTVLEIVLGIDNVIFISILSSRLPVARQSKARRIGLALAMVMRNSRPIRRRGRAWSNPRRAFARFGPVANHSARHCFLARFGHHGRRHGRSDRDYDRRGSDCSGGDDGVRRRHQPVRRAASDDQDAGLELSFVNWHELDRGRRGLSHSEGIHLFRDGFFRLRGDAQSPSEAKERPGQIAPSAAQQPLMIR